MAINPASAINAYANAARMAGTAAPPVKGAAQGFGQLVRNAAGSLVDSLGQAEKQSMQAVTGNADLAAVTQAVTDAQVALQTVVAVRDRVISAYQDIIKMPI
jgi:flagellar hook-basal body complex protein FliE